MSTPATIVGGVALKQCNWRDFWSILKAQTDAQTISTMRCLNQLLNQAAQSHHLSQQLQVIYDMTIYYFNFKN